MKAQRPTEITDDRTLVWYDGPVFFTMKPPQEGLVFVALWSGEDMKEKTLSFIVVEVTTLVLWEMEENLIPIRDFLVQRSERRWVAVTDFGWKTISWTEELTSDELVEHVGDSGLPVPGAMLAL